MATVDQFNNVSHRWVVELVLVYTHMYVSLCTWKFEICMNVIVHTRLNYCCLDRVVATVLKCPLKPAEERARVIEKWIDIAQVSTTLCVLDDAFYIMLVHV